MADLSLSIFEKYTDSWRIDHPDSGDVSKTTYAKGTIKEIKVIDPIYLQVAPLVKVDIEGQGVSDWLPLFYHPKKLYWDDPPRLAQAFNEAEEYFEKAWMSFRIDDEVAVMLKKDVPVLVLGFADGVPRIGEDIIKSEYGAGHWWQCSLVSQYKDGDVGPDKLNLGLKLKAKKFHIGSQSYEQGPGTVSSSTTWTTKELISRTTVYDPGFFMLPATDTIWVVGATYLHGTGKDSKKKTTWEFDRYLVVVGPILYLINQATGVTSEYWGPETTGVEGPNYWAPNSMLYPHEGPNFIRHTYDGWGDPFQHIPGLPDLDYPEAEGYADAYIAAAMATNPPVTTGLPLPDPIKSTGLSGVWKAIYSKEVYEKAQTISEEALASDPDFVQDIPMLNLMNTNNSFGSSPDPYAPWPPDGSLQFELSGRYPGYKNTGNVDLKFSAHPHTKQELQAAGMWPQG